MMLTGKRARTLLAAGLLAVAPLAFAGHASAQSNAELMRLIQQLTNKVESLENQVQNATATAKAADTKASAVQSSAKGEDCCGMKYKWGPSMTFKSADGNFEMHVRGRLFVDFGHVNDDIGVQDRTATEFRTARLGIEGKAWKEVKYKFEIDFAGDEVTIKDAYLQYRGWKPFKITVGQFKELVSLEEITSGRHTAFMERAAITDAFGFQRRLGIGIEGAWNGFGLRLGIYGGSAMDANEDDEGFAFAARAYYNLELGNGDGTLHIGGSLRYRDLKNDIDGTDVRYRQRPFAHVSGTRYVSTGTVDYIKSDLFVGAELAATVGPFWASSEFGWITADVVSGMESSFNGESSFTNMGGYFDIGWFVTGESRPIKGDKWDRPKVNNPLFEGGIGAVALAFRLDYLDLNDFTAGVNGGEQISYIFGVTWYWNRHTRVMLNYARTEVDDGVCRVGFVCNWGDAEVGADGKASIDAVTARFQIDW